MKNNKIKLVSIILIGFLCVLIGSPSIKAEIQTKTLSPNQYWGLGTTLNFGDTLNFRIESDPLTINIYIMNQGQIDYYTNNPIDDAISYIERWTGYYLLTDSFVAEHSQKYFILMINPSDSLSTDVEVDASVDEYVVPKTITISDPVDIYDYGYIYWTYTGDIDYVKIDLYRDGYFLETIDSFTDNDGFYSWEINDYINSSYYQIKISDYYYSSIYDYSDYFTIECEIDVPDPVSDPVPDDPIGIPSFNLLIVIGIIGSISTISAIIVKRRIKKLN